MTLATEHRKCEGHGAYHAREYMPGRFTSCPTCSEEAQERRAVAERERQREQRKRDLLQDFGADGRFREATFESFVASTPAQATVLSATRAFAAAFRPDQGAGLFMIGPPGVGKTHLACAIARAVIEQHCQVSYVATAREVIRDLRDTWRSRRPDRSEADVIEFFGEVPLLVLDEVGGGFASDTERAQLFDVIDRRYRLRRPTVVASNLPVPEIRTVVGDRSYDRLREGARTLLLDWPSHRSRAQ
jgi:DNA replication protein DnaC